MSPFPITGQLFLRDQGAAADGRRLVMVVGVLAFPTVESFPNEHQVTIAGAMAGDGAATLTALMDGTHAIDRKDEARGWAADNLLTAPIWRV